MPPPLAVDKEAVRVLVVAVGPREAARRMGLKEDTVKQWSKRGRWLAHLRPENQPKAPPSMQQQIVPGVTKAADALAEALSDDSRETRLSLSRGARQMAKDAETATLAQAGDVLQVGKLAALVHGWDDGRGSSGTTINVLIQ